VRLVGRPPDGIYGSAFVFLDGSISCLIEKDGLIPVVCLIRGI
jgi:hypothetical protein